MQVLGVPIEARSMEDAAEKGGWIVTANPEILLYAHRHPEYREGIVQADQRTADGFGLWAWMKLHGQNAKRVTGVDLSEYLIQTAWKKGWKVGLFGGESDEADIAARGLQSAYPDLNVHAEQGGRVNIDGTADNKTDEALQRMIQYGPQLLLVAMGHPRQEMWIAIHKKDFPELKAVVGVGGTFNFWAGKSKRAPVFLQKIGLEWMWRLMMEPKRWKRILDAVIVFPWTVLISKK
ncbi:WecB/TagA/CpsF family glycosyltransferase [Candidatus Uhrbacteria bacterium]|nr:WecB/TagA/CpsF family glycosyltransferase [Candidatus Uhrbacteria bacterium]